MLSTAARRTGRLAASVPLAVLYTIGAIAAVVVVVCVVCASAVRLGWSDIRKQATTHGPA